MLISNVINDSFGLLSKQLRFYCWHFQRDLDQRQRQELIQLLYEQHFERLASKIKTLNQNAITDGKQQIGRVLFEHCLSKNRRHQLIQLIESGLVDVNVKLDNYGRTLLHRAAYNLDVELVKILIEHNVNIKLRDYAGNTALHIAIQSYRNGALIYGSGPDVVKNLTSILQILLTADQNELRSATSNDNKFRNKKVRLALVPVNPSKLNQLQLQYSTNINDPSQSEQQQSYNIRNRCPPNNGTIHEPLVDMKNAFGRTALHYCVLVVGERYLDHFVKLLISFGADTDSMDTRMKTPLYCLVKRPGVAAIRQKCRAISYLLETGCDDLGLAIDGASYFSDKVIEDLEKSISRNELQAEPIFTSTYFMRPPSLKHLSRLNIIRNQEKKVQQKRQTQLSLPISCPASLNIYINRKILDQSELT